MEQQIRTLDIINTLTTKIILINQNRPILIQCSRPLFHRQLERLLQDIHLPVLQESTAILTVLFSNWQKYKSFHTRRTSTLTPTTLVDLYNLGSWSVNSVCSDGSTGYRYLHQTSPPGQVTTLFEHAWLIAPPHVELEGEEWRRRRERRSLKSWLEWWIWFRPNWRGQNV